VDAEAVAGDDYVALDRVIEFKKGQKSEIINVQIIDDEEWEPDEDFFIKLYDPETGDDLDNVLFGDDAVCRVTILDDDYPGQLMYEEKETIKAPATDEFAYIVVKRINGSDGVVTVDYTTQEMPELGGMAALPGIHYVESSGTLIF
jgi:solute carrier family 8 (sodium/calcium exchanger)